jgi:hypothetical protein
MMSKSFNHFGKIAESIKPACSQVVRKVALDAQANIQAQIVANNQIDTGFMLNSVYTQTSDGSTYKGGENALPETARPSKETEAHIAVGANYAVHQNYGTRFLPPRPFWEPGIERTRPGFEQAMKIIEQKMREAAS